MGVAGIVVTVRAVSDDTQLAEAMTDRAGQALLQNIAAARVRVQLRGTTKEGVPLRLQAYDAEGIILHLDGADTTLALRVERTGTVIVDPTSWAQEPVTRATSAGAVGATPASAAPALAAESLAVEAPPAQSALPLVLLLVLLGLMIVLVLCVRRVS
jgi:hypothetical protein